MLEFVASFGSDEHVLADILSSAQSFCMDHYHRASVFVARGLNFQIRRGRRSDIRGPLAAFF